MMDKGAPSGMGVPNGASAPKFYTN